MYAAYAPQVWFDGEYLFWWLKGFPIAAPLLTTGPMTGVPGVGFGILGSPGTQLLFGNETIDEGQAQGGRFTIGGWLFDLPGVGPGLQPVGGEASYFFLGRRAAEFGFTSDAAGVPLLARPVIDTRTGAETVLLVSAPGAFGATGGFRVSTSTELWGAEANLFLPVTGSKGCMLGFLAGARYLNLEESLVMDQSTSLLPGGVGFFNGLTVRAPSTFGITDDFETRNNFWGGQIGAQVVFHYGPLSLTALGKVALGTMHEVVRISGSTTLTQPLLGSQTVPGGLLALATNSGGFGRYEFAAVPEGRLTLSWQVANKVALSAGYTFLYASDVVRPGQQIDRNVNANFLPTSQGFGRSPFGPAAPGFTFRPSDFWAQGLTFGLTLSF
jgi:hypothetical protein